MSVVNTGRKHNWFAWHPVFTDCGWTWMRTVTRYRIHLDLPGAPTFWEYTRKDKP